MKKGIFLRARVAGLVVAAALVASCYAPIANQKGYLNLGLQLAKSVAAPTEAVVLVIDAGYGDSFREMLSLVNQGYHGSLSTSEQDRLRTLGELLTTSAAVKFGGTPFYQATLNATAGSFQIPGVPAGRDYFVKVFVMNQGVSFAAKDFDENFFNLIQSQNLAFAPEAYTTPWQNWTLATGQPVTVNAGESAPISVTLTGTVP
jgi:hypothetical protein